MEKLIDAMVQRLGQELKGLLSRIESGTLPGVAIETLLRERLWHVGAQAMGVMLAALDARLSAGRAVQDRRERTVVSLFGPVRITRRRCREGGGWRYPLDDALKLMGHRGWSVGVQEAVSLLSCDCSFQTTRDLLGRLLGLTVGVASVQRVAEGSGRRAEGLLAADRAASAQGEPSVLPPACRASARTLVVAIDGCLAPQRDGWHEVKVGTLYANAWRRRGRGRRALLAKGYYASLAHADGFGEGLWSRAYAWGVLSAKRVGVMGDGAAWIWNLSALHFPGATEIVDFYHAVEHLWTVGEALWGDRTTSATTRGWVRHWRERLKRGDVDALIATVTAARKREAKALSSERRKTVDLNVDYFTRNRDRMAYAAFRRQHLAIGSGAVEGACKFVVQSRFKRPGSRWSARGLHRLLALRLLRLNDHWDLLWPHLKAA